MPSALKDFWQITKFYRATPVEILEDFRMESNKGRLTVWVTKCVTAATLASFWKGMHSSLAMQVPKTLPPGTSHCPFVELTMPVVGRYEGRVELYRLHITLRSTATTLTAHGPF
ncbi:hypothetical protein JRQ81_011915 [Phrynocephalus forsythii]|uniref:Uncharacterized protein n=1 Tax=Phrynocephalus forsythii TaxID=171643 RepID=A0A9Q1AQK5_9SAUR|nr:hypothetical protein JRQ81_011915 [Phrynocephalus forsythii]